MIEPDFTIGQELYFTRRSLAQLLGKKEATLAAWVSLGKGPAYVQLGRKVLYPEKKVLEWVGKQMVVPGKEE